MPLEQQTSSVKHTDTFAPYKREVAVGMRSHRCAGTLLLYWSDGADSVKD